MASNLCIPYSLIRTPRDDAGSLAAPQRKLALSSKPAVWVLLRRGTFTLKGAVTRTAFSFELSYGMAHHHRLHALKSTLLFYNAHLLKQVLA